MYNPSHLNISLVVFFLSSLILSELWLNIANSDLNHYIKQSANPVSKSWQLNEGSLKCTWTPLYCSQSTINPTLRECISALFVTLSLGETHDMLLHILLHFFDYLKYIYIYRQPLGSSKICKNQKVLLEQLVVMRELGKILWCSVHNWHVYWSILTGNAVLRDTLANVQGEMKGEVIGAPKVK